MTRIIAISDTHLENEELPRGLVDLAKSADLLLHAGDFVSPEAYSALKDLGKLKAVRGNADSAELKRLLPERQIVVVEGVRIGMVHMASHAAGLLGAGLMAREMDVQVLVFGHIHWPLVEQGARLLICPGSPTFPRMSDPSVAELDIEDGGISGKIISLGSPTCDYFKYAQSLAEKGGEKSFGKKS
ncbi:MAG TPA: metallophosphoesterase [Methanothrix sp.]|nr:metallophosphoesterase [Methanothrix sp.]